MLPTWRQNTNRQEGHPKTDLSLAYMERLFSRCSVRKNKSWRANKNRKNSQQKVVLAEGIDPINTQGKKLSDLLQLLIYLNLNPFMGLFNHTTHFLLFIVYRETAELHWRFTSKIGNLRVSKVDGLGQYDSKKQKRRTVKNAKLVFAIKDVNFARFNQDLPIIQLQKKITYQNSLKMQHWKNIRTIKLSSSRPFHFIVVGVKSLVRHYLKVIIIISITYE